MIKILDLKGDVFRTYDPNIYSLHVESHYNLLTVVDNNDNVVLIVSLRNYSFEYTNK